MNDPISRNIMPAFAIPLGTFQLLELDELNDALSATLLTRETAEYRHHQTSQKVQPEVFESRFDLFEWPDPPIQKLRGIICSYLRGFIARVNNMDIRRVEQLQMHQDVWAHITRRNGYVQPHNHPNASWSCVYCVQTGQKDTGHEDSGALVMMSPNSGASRMFRDPANDQLIRQFSDDAIRFHLKPGSLIIFPSDLVHFVSPFIGDGERITIAGNFWFEHQAGARQ